MKMIPHGSALLMMAMSGQHTEVMIEPAHRKDFLFADFARQADQTPKPPSASASTIPSPRPVKPPQIRTIVMGKRKKPRNVVKIDMGGISKNEKVIPVLVPQKSKDGRRWEQTVHNVPVPQEKPRPPTFDPSPAYGASHDDTFPELHDPMNEPDGPDRVRPFLFPQVAC